VNNAVVISQGIILVFADNHEVAERVNGGSIGIAFRSVRNGDRQLRGQLALGEKDRFAEKKQQCYHNGSDDREAFKQQRYGHSTIRADTVSTDKGINIRKAGKVSKG